jgi:predicted transcriptional regulator
LRPPGDGRRAPGRPALDILRIESYSIQVTTTVHLPPELLKRVDERARGLNVSRNQYIRRALERMVREETAWSGDFLDALDRAAADEESHAAVDEMMRGIARRSRKRPPQL